MNKTIRNLIVGRNNYIESWNEFRQVMLSGQYGLIASIVLIIYFFKELSPGSIERLITLGFAIVAILFSIGLHRYRLHCTANLLLFFTLNIVVFLLGSSEKLSTGAFMFLIPLAFGSFAVFNYKHRKIAVLFCVFGLLLFGLALTGWVSIIPVRHYPEAITRVTRVINFCVTFSTSMILIYLLVSISHYNARKLVEANRHLTLLNEELDRFAYSTSHDLRAPLQSVKGLLTIAEGAKPEEVAGYHKIMHARLDTLDKLIKDMSDYSRNNRLQIMQEPIKVADVLNKIWESLQFCPIARQIEFINEVPEDLVVINDGRRLKVVLSNLIGNAIQYHDMHKERKYIRLYHELTDSSFSLHIEDNGQGVAPELHEKIFDMFFRGNELSQGSGLGLYIVKETLSKLSGKILLQSTLREGSVFSIKLPV